MFVRSFDTKSAPRISRKRFDLESVNFKKTSTQTLAATTPDMTSSSTSRNVGSYREKQSKISPPTVSGRIYRERLKLGSLNFTH